MPLLQSRLYVVLQQQLTVLTPSGHCGLVLDNGHVQLRGDGRRHRQLQAPVHPRYASVHIAVKYNDTSAHSGPLRQYSPAHER
jgi:hypothetical protein